METENRFKLARTKYNQHGPQSVKEVSEITGVTGSLIDDLESTAWKRRDVGYSKIVKLANHYGVTSDYLLGLATTPSVDEDIQAACKTTGLTEEAIKEIKATRGWGLDVLNCFLENRDFFRFLMEVRRLAVAKYQLQVAEAELKVRVQRLATDKNRIRVIETETGLIETVATGYEKTVMNLTEKRDVRVYWVIKNFENLLSAIVDELISHPEFQKFADMANNTEVKKVVKGEVEDHGKH